jgi:hypothetical protein
MDLKEYIKSLIRKQLEETSATGAIGVGAGPIMTPNWVAPKGQKINAATKTAKKQGFTVTKGETTMPGDSKVKDYVSLTGKKKKKVKIYENMSIEDALKQIRPLLAHTIEHDRLSGSFEELLAKVKAGDDEILDKMWNLAGSAVDKYAINTLSKINESGYDQPSKYGAASGYRAASPYSAASKYGAASDYTKNESLMNIVKEELLNEVTYHKFKNEVKFRTKNEQLHKAIREVKRKLQEIDRIVEYTSRMKQELSEGEEGLRYWKNTEKNVSTISEMVNQLNNKIKNLQQ